MNNSSSDKAITLAPKPASYIQFVRFSVVTSLTTLLVIALIICGSNLVGSGARPFEFRMELGIFVGILGFGLLPMIPVLLASLTVGYALWRLVLRLGGGIILCAAAAATMGSLALAIQNIGMTSLILSVDEANVNYLGLLVHSFGRIYLVAGPIAVIVGWRQYVRE